MSGEAEVFEQASPELSFEPHPLSGGAFVMATLGVPRARARLRLGSVEAAGRFVACFRPEPFWMQPRVGKSLSDVPRGSQFLLIERGVRDVLLVVPLTQAPFHVSIEGEADGALWLVLDSGEPTVVGTEAVVAYVALGQDPYRLCRDGARAVAERLGTFALRRDKPRPAFAELFGWCTWDAFYQDVSEAGLEAGLRALRDGGILPGFVILDDGWQSVTKKAEGAPRLASFAANAKFPEGLSACVRRLKAQHDVRHFLVWHAVHGYWGGVDASSFPEYGVEEIARSYSPEVLAHFPAANREYWGESIGRPALSALPRFYDDYHAELRRAGVDGVKIDNQASIEGVVSGQGGRVHAMQQTREALEASASRHFGTGLINCMSCSSDMFYTDRSGALTRTSTDFWPNRPETHGLHVHTNAVVGLWFGELVHPDWDMFQSAHPAGPFHAAARAVSGSAVYVSDKPGQHDFALLGELVASEGRTLCAIDVGVPTRDCLFVDPVVDPRLFKVINQNRCGNVMGIFNATLERSVKGTLSPSDIPAGAGALADADFAVYLKRADRLLRAPRSGVIELELAPLSAEVATFAEVVGGVAVLGLSNKLNGGAALSKIERGHGWVEVEVCDGGTLLALCERAPRRVTSGGEGVEARWLNQRLDVELAGSGARRVRIEL